MFQQLKEQAIAQRLENEVSIYGVDNSGRVLGMCRANLKAADLLDKITLKIADFKDFTPPFQKGIIISNPPYGERLGSEMEMLYTNLGDVFKQKFKGWTAWIISSNFDALKKVGLKPSQKIKLYNGSLECKFVEYEMYEGSKKLSKEVKK